MAAASPMRRIRCRPVCSKGIMSAACRCTASNSRVTLASQSSATRTGTVAMAGPAMSSIPGTAACCPVTVTPYKASSMLPQRAITTAQAALAMVACVWSLRPQSRPGMLRLKCVAAWACAMVAVLSKGK